LVGQVPPPVHEDTDLARAAGRRGRERFEAHFEVSRFRHGFEQLVLDAIGEREVCHH
jgi:hypothetical protein